MRVLVVDDKEESLYLLQALLTGHGHEVETARDGARALELARERPPDLVISDILMPVLDGFSLCRRWTQEPALERVPFVFYTATYTEPEDERLALSLGADAFIVKPVEPEQFLARIRDVVERRGRGQLVAREVTPEPEGEYLREYNAVLIRKLEAKLVQLEEANRELAEKDRFNDAVLDAMTAPVAVVGRQGEVLATNRAWSAFAREDGQFLGLRRGDNALAALDSVDAGEALGRVREGLREVLAERTPEQEIELPYGDEDEPRWFTVRIERVGAAGAAAVVACIDVTVHRQAATALEEAGRRKDEFLAMLGHELRNPLAPIWTASHVLKLLGLGDPRAEQARQVIDRQVEHLARIVDDLLDVSRLVRGKMVLERSPTDFAQVVRATAEDLRPGFHARGVGLDVHVPAASVWIRADATRMAQVVANLLDNAQKFTDRGGRVEVLLMADESAGEGSLIVRDTGIGMTAQTIGRIFRPFEQAPQSSARTHGGMGMGLALVKGIVDLHEGEVRASSPGLGHGSEFVVRIPLGEAPGPRPPAEGPGAEGSGVLVIEDNRDAADSLEALLTMAGCRVNVAYDALSGLALARAEKPETILCDIGLSGEMDGYAVARAIRADPALHATHLVALTGYGQEEDRRRAMEAGFEFHVTKPADPQELLGLVARLHRRPVGPK